MMNYFAGGSTEQELMDTLNRIAPECPECRGKRLHFCIEKECEGSEPFCLICQSHQHFLHRKNELRMLFVDRSFVGLSSRQAFDRAERLSQLILTQKKRSEQFIDNQLALLKSYTQVLNELDRLKSHLITGDHLTTMYNIVEKGVLGNLSSYKEAQQDFLRAFRQVKLENRHWQLGKLGCVKELLRTLANYQDNPLSIVDPSSRTISECLQSVINERSQLATVETMLRQTNIERFISQQCPAIYWHAADYNHRSRRCKVSEQQKCKGSRLLIELDGSTPSVSCDILVKNTLKELTITSELINVVRFPEHLQKLVVVMLPANITSITQKIPPTLKVLKATVLSTYWSQRVPYALKNMAGLRYVVLRDFGMRPAEAKQLMQLGIANEVRVMTFLKDEPKANIAQSRVRDSRPESVYTHAYPKLQPHYLVYKRKVLQVQRINRSRHILSSKYLESILQLTIVRAEYAWEKKEQLDHLVLSRRVSLEGDKNETEETQ